MELIGYDVTLEPTGLHKITLDCIGTEDDLVTIRKVYNTGIWQGIGLSRSGEKENKTMTATELRRIEAEAYEKGYAKGMENTIRAARSTYGFVWNNDEANAIRIATKDLIKIKKVIFNDPATIVFWADGTKTVAKAHGDDKFDKEVGLTVCIAKKALGNRSNFDKVFKKWIK